MGCFLFASKKAPVKEHGRVGGDLVTGSATCRRVSLDPYQQPPPRGERADQGRRRPPPQRRGLHRSQPPAPHVAAHGRPGLAAGQHAAARQHADGDPNDADGAGPVSGARRRRRRRRWARCGPQRARRSWRVEARRAGAAPPACRRLAGHARCQAVMRAPMPF
ncbi:MAG: hypothetical protein J3K34DRAFT_217786 [Monoraphidium minutum]|nr:MAG: hypothetical protein J3K34DRAFT_217786 [Monoraphidium minutum]